MKKFKLLAIFVMALFTFNHQTKSSAMIAGEIASVVGPLLMPIVKKESQAIFLTVFEGVKKLKAKSTRCKVLCNGTGLITPCKTSTGLSACKAMCQETKQIGGYEIKLRFWDSGSIANCLKAAVKAQLQTTEGKGNTKSISVYSQEDLNVLIELISYVTAAEKIIISKGGMLNIKVTSEEVVNTRKLDTRYEKLNDQEITKMIVDAKSKDAYDNAFDVKKHAESQIDTLVKSGRFGSQ